jgi:branched-chain amino acid transport system ATP-binding protein
MSALLEVAGVTAFYGQAQALFGVDLTVVPGQVVALLGRNGMGKSTTIRTICRLMRQRDGVVRFAGCDLAHTPSHKAARLGIGLVPEGRRCFGPLTVWENVIAAARPGPVDAVWDWRAVTTLFPSLAERRHQTARTLSGGEQQMLAIARALMTNPMLLVLDEATEGLAPVIRQEIWAALGQLKANGQSILLVDKNLSELALIADSYVILERGRTVWRGTPADLTPAIRDQFLGV